MSQDLSFHLYVEKGPQQGLSFSLSNGEASLGRGNSNQVVIRDEKSSREHALIRMRGSTVQLVDIGSSNGTFLNGKQIEESCPAVLRPGDKIRIGSTVLIFQKVMADKLSGCDLTAGETSKSLSEVCFDDPCQIGNELPGLQQSISPKDFDWFVGSPIVHSPGGTQSTGSVKQLLGLFLSLFPAEQVCLLVRNPTTAAFEIAAVSQSESEDVNPKVISQRVINHVSERRAGVRTNVILEIPGLDDEPRRVICVPVQNEGELQAAIYLEQRLDKISPENHFTSNHLNSAQLLALQAGPVVGSLLGGSSLGANERHRLVGQTVAGLSHYIKNLFQSLNGGSYLLNRGLEKNDIGPVKTGWPIIRKNQDRLAQLLLDLAELSKVGKVSKKLCEIDSILESAVRKQQGVIGDNKLGIVLYAVSNSRSISVDDSAVERAVSNILGHLIFSADEDCEGQIQVSALFSENSVLITIKDDFLTIREDQLVSLFQPVDHELRNEIGGLTLAVAKKIIEEQDGSVSVERNGDSSGSTKNSNQNSNGLVFKIKLPVAT